MSKRRPAGILLTLLVAFSVLMGVSAPAYAGPVDDLVKAIEKKYAGVETMKAKFTQVARNELFGDETTKGEVFVKKPAKMRWSFGTERLFVTNGKKMWIYTAEDKQVIVYDDVAQAAGSADSFLTSLDKLDEQFDVKVLASGDDGHEIELTPKSDEQFKRVRLALTGDLLIRRVVLTDPFDQVTEITLENLQLNQPIPDEMFTFTVPSGAEVVSATTN